MSKQILAGSAPGTSRTDADRPQPAASASGGQTTTPPKTPKQPPKAPAKPRKPAEGERPAKAARGRPAASRSPAAAAARPDPVTPDPRPSLLIVAQAGRLEFESLIFAASLHQNSPEWLGQLVIAEPAPEGAWSGHETRIAPQTREVLEWLGVQIRPFSATRFGAGYPHGNKIEALSVLPEDRPFVFFDTDTLILSPLDQLHFDFDRPSASMRREGTWPEPPIYGPGYAGIWKSLYDRFGLDFESSLDRSQPDEHWERYLYFNAGWFFGRNPALFGRRFGEWADDVRRDPGEALACQSLDPWLDQVVLPLVIHSFYGGRPGPGLAGLDGDVTCHYRNLPLLYARESDLVLDRLEAATGINKVKKRLREWEPARRLIYQGKGRDQVRKIYAGGPPPGREMQIRKQIRNRGWWLV